MRCTRLAANTGRKKSPSRHHRTTLSGHIFFIVIFCTICIRLAIFDCNMVERQLAGAVHVGAVQSAVAHAVYRFRSLSSSEYDRRLADHCQHVDRRHVLRTVRRTHDHRHPVVRHLQTTLPREGPKYYNLPS